jgi:hypothetical protein
MLPPIDDEISTDRKIAFMREALSDAGLDNRKIAFGEDSSDAILRVLFEGHSWEVRFCQGGKTQTIGVFGSEHDLTDFVAMKLAEGDNRYLYPLQEWSPREPAGEEKLPEIEEILNCNHLFAEGYCVNSTPVEDSITLWPSGGVWNITSVDHGRHSLVAVVEGTKDAVQFFAVRMIISKILFGGETPYSIVSIPWATLK